MLFHFEPKHSILDMKSNELYCNVIFVIASMLQATTGLRCVSGPQEFFMGIHKSVIGN